MKMSIAELKKEIQWIHFVSAEGDYDIPVLKLVKCRGVYGKLKHQFLFLR